MLSYLLSNEAAECDRLLDALPVAINRASCLLQQRSVHDLTYLEADIQVSKILARVSELSNRIHAHIDDKDKTKAHR
jgi:hypothetical protein